ncbi:hypothetical protein [Streptomyces sp. ISL-100]|uniref:hypothetical protein n=1 Tax=Streptomyces sp. ISL-100 TaxID=2819173 RepID=UPI001BE863F0|nr:hypothetical protein [Streptomyces sp. ISL-100]MBT2396279.1 hypothetical protein [Streptomyces sp. ISL-100]
MWKDVRPVVAVMALAGLIFGAGVGYLTTRDVTSTLTAAVCCAIGTGGAAFVRLRQIRQQQAEAKRNGFGAALAQGALIAVACYHRAAFPRTGSGAVTDEEVAELRWVAYQQAAAERLDAPVREAAARALKAVDIGDPGGASSFLMDLMGAVHEQHMPARTRWSARR